MVPVSYLLESNHGEVKRRKNFEPGAQRICMNIRSVLSWVFGVLLTLLGLLLLIGVPPVGVLVTLVGLYILPPVNRRIQINISFTRTVAWVTGGALFFFALTITHLVPVAGVIAVVGGLFALPPVRRYLTSWTDLQPGRWTVVGVVILVIVSSSGIAAIALENNERLGHETKVHGIGERFTVDSGEINLAVTVKDVKKHIYSVRGLTGRGQTQRKSTSSLPSK